MPSTHPVSAERSRLLDNDHMETPSYNGNDDAELCYANSRTSSVRKQCHPSAKFAAKFGEEPPSQKKAISGFVVWGASVVGVATYLLLGVLVYCLMAGMSALDALYFCVVTLTTVGYGDLSAHTQSTKLFACVYIIVGVAMVGALLATLVEMLLDREEQLLLAVMRKVPRPKAKRDEVADDQESMSKSACAMRQKDMRVKVWGGILSLLLLMGAGTFLFVCFEHLSVVDALYLTVVSASTVGYGDYHPGTPATKVFAIFFLPLTTLLLAKIVSDYTSLQVELSTEARQHRILHQAISANDFNEMDKDGDGQVDPMEFMCRTLVAQEKLQQADIDEVMLRFHELDSNGDGYLDKSETILRHRSNADIETGDRGSLQ